MTDDQVSDESTDESERRINDRRKLVLVVDGEGAKPASAPRRSGADRRSGERRRVSQSVGKDRRSGERRRRDRRSDADRRIPGDRRGQGPPIFNSEEAARILTEARSGGPVACPRCRNQVTLRPPIASEDRSVWVVHCATCQCRLRIENL